MRRRRIFARAAWAVILMAAAACGERSSPSAAVPSPTPQPAVPGDVRGVVQLADSQDSSGIQVFVPGGSALAMTDSEGRYVFSDLKPGVYSFTAQRPGYKNADLGEVEIADSPQKETYRLRDARLEPLAARDTPPPVTLGSASGTIRSSVVIDGETGLAGALVTLEGTPIRTFTDADGSFYLWNLQPGSYQLTASLEGYETAQVPLEITAGESPETVEVSLEPIEGNYNRKQITGIIELLNNDGTLSPDFGIVQAGLRELPDARVIVQSDGAFRAGPLASRVYTIFAEAPGYETAEAQVDLTESESESVVLTLGQLETPPEEPATLAGVARKNIEGLTDMSGISVALGGTSFVAMTNAAGEYRIANISPGVYSLIAQADGFEKITIEELELGSGELELEPLLLEPIRIYPAIVQTNPPDGADDVTIAFDMPFFIRFNKKVRPESVRAAVTVVPPAEFRVFAGKQHPQSDFDLAIVEIDGSSEENPLRYDTRYRILVSEAIEDFEGLNMQEPFVLNFRTARPGVMATVPPDEATNVSLAPMRPVVVQFNARLDPQSIDRRAIRIRPDRVAIPTINVANNPKTGWTEVHIQATWEQDTVYTITVGRGIKTFDGKSLSNTPYTFRFKTAKLRELPPLGPVPR